MALQANKPPLNFSYIDQTENQKGFKQYVQVIQDGDYELIQGIFIRVLEQSII